MKRLDVLVLILIILIIVGIAIWSNSDQQAEGEEQRNAEIKPSYLERVQIKIQQIESQIKAEADTLQLTTEMEEFLEKRITIYSLLLKILIAIIVLAIFCSLYLNGETLLASVFTTAGICSVTLAVIPFLFMSRVLDINTTMQAFRKWVRKLVYKKFGHDPQIIRDLKTSISLKTAEVSMLKSQHPELKS